MVSVRVLLRICLSTLSDGGIHFHSATADEDWNLEFVASHVKAENLAVALASLTNLDSQSQMKLLLSILLVKPAVLVTVKDSVAQLASHCLTHHEPWVRFAANLVQLRLDGQPLLEVPAEFLPTYPSTPLRHLNLYPSSRCVFAQPVAAVSDDRSGANDSSKSRIEKDLLLPFSVKKRPNPAPWIEPQDQVPMAVRGTEKSGRPVQKPLHKSSALVAPPKPMLNRKRPRDNRSRMAGGPQVILLSADEPVEGLLPTQVETSSHGSERTRTTNPNVNPFGGSSGGGGDIAVDEDGKDEGDVADAPSYVSSSMKQETGTAMTAAPLRGVGGSWAASGSQATKQEPTDSHPLTSTATVSATSTAAMPTTVASSTASLLSELSNLTGTAAVPPPSSDPPSLSYEQLASLTAQQRMAYQSFVAGRPLPSETLLPPNAVVEMTVTEVHGGKYSLRLDFGKKAWAKVANV
jgi:hypothetical protein